MGLVMDLVSGDSGDITLAVAVDHLNAFTDGVWVTPQLSLRRSIDPTWPDLFGQAARAVTGGEEPVDFLEARSELDGPDAADARTVERIDPAWITAVARLSDHQLDAIAGRWIDLLEDELGELAREEKPSVRVFASQIVEFARRADRAPRSEEHTS